VRPVKKATLFPAPLVCLAPPINHKVDSADPSHSPTDPHPERGPNRMTVAAGAAAASSVSATTHDRIASRQAGPSGRRRRETETGKRSFDWPRLLSSSGRDLGLYEIRGAMALAPP
jgi:hypothetical protein